MVWFGLVLVFEKKLFDFDRRKRKETEVNRNIEDLSITFITHDFSLFFFKLGLIDLGFKKNNFLGISLGLFHITTCFLKSY